MSGYAGCVTSALAGAACLAGSFTFTAMAQGAPPNFAPDASVGWYAYNRQFIPPASSPGPVQQDRARRRIHFSNSPLRARHHLDGASEQQCRCRINTIDISS
jgi:hypothetical protein